MPPRPAETTLRRQLNGLPNQSGCILKTYGDGDPLRAEITDRKTQSCPFPCVQGGLGKPPEGLAMAASAESRAWGGSRRLTQPKPKRVARRVEDILGRIEHGIMADCGCAFSGAQSESSAYTEGRRVVGGRWELQRHRVIYMSESRALAVLEVLVHLPSREYPTNTPGLPLSPRILRFPPCSEHELLSGLENPAIITANGYPGTSETTGYEVVMSARAQCSFRNR